MKFALLVFYTALSLIEAKPEKVWLRDVDADHDSRHSDGGLPETINFRLRREDGAAELGLHLTENHRLNAHAPVYEVTTLENGQQTLVKKRDVPQLDMKFYHDTSIGGSFQVRCEKQASGSCLRKVRGTMMVEGNAYDLTPDPRVGGSTPDNHGNDGVPHLLEANSYSTADKHKFSRGTRGTDVRYIPGSILSRINSKQKQLAKRRAGVERTANEKNQKPVRRNKRGDNTNAVEVLVVADPALWHKYYKNATATSTMNKERVAELQLRRHFSHIINGVSLRYESIHDPGIHIYVTLSGFIFLKKANESILYPPTADVTVVGETKFVEIDAYLDNIVAWLGHLQHIDNNDHTMVFTAYDLYAGEHSSTTTHIRSNNGAAGQTFMSGMCLRPYSVSIIEESSHFATVSTAAHELGHNLGSCHDGTGSSKSCQKDWNFIMSRTVVSYSGDQEYASNPWRFSECSIQAFKTFISSLGDKNCLRDHGDYYNKNDVTTPSPGPPSPRPPSPVVPNTPDEQCKRMEGDHSGLCLVQDRHDEKICVHMLCQAAEDTCKYYPAAERTPCGYPAQKQWCQGGKCVKTFTHGSVGGEQTTLSGSTVEQTTISGSGGEQTTISGSGGEQDQWMIQGEIVNFSDGVEDADTSGSGQCVDTMWNNWTCSQLSSHIHSHIKLSPAQWCADEKFGRICCKFCKSNHCVDTGWERWSCDELAKYFHDKQKLVPSQWCDDVDYRHRCCEFCSGF